MKLKFINLLLVALTLVGSAQILTSCKDTNEDMYQNLEYVNQTLSQRVEDNARLIEQLQATIRVMQANCPSKCLAKFDSAAKANGYETWTFIKNYIDQMDFNLRQELLAAIQQNAESHLTKEDVEDIIEELFGGDPSQGSSQGNGAVDAVVQTVISELVDKGYVDMDQVKDFLLGNYYTKEQVDSAIAAQNHNQLTEQQIEAIVNRVLGDKDYVTREELNTELAKYYTQEQIDDMFGDYVKKDQFDSLVAGYLAANEEYQAIKSMYEQLNAALDALSGHNGSYAEFFVYIEQTLQSVQNSISTLNSSVTALNESITNINGNITDINGNITNINNTLVEYNTQLQTLNTFMNDWKDVLPTIQSTANAAYLQAQNNLSSIQALYTVVSQLKAADKAINDKLELFGQDIDELYTLVSNAQQKAEDAYTLAQQNLEKATAYTDQQIAKLSGGYDGTLKDLYDLIQTNANDIAGLDQAIKQNAQDIQELTEQLEDLLDLPERVTVLENRISSIVLQGTYNNVFGYFATPFGINANIVMNYIGENTRPVSIMFPSNDEGIEYDGASVITDKDFDMLDACGLVSETYASGQVFMQDCDGNLGTVYLTLNPSNVDLTGKEFTVVNSVGKEYPVVLKNLRPSTEELTFGFSRTATSANGFYEADATVDPKQAGPIRLTIDHGLKSAAEQVLNERSPRTLLSLGNALYDQVNGMLPALGICAAWDENGKAQSVHSQYGLAATVFHPLSYSFFYGHSLRQIPIPDFTGIFDFQLTADGIKIDLSDIKLNVDLSGVEFDVNLGLSCVLDPVTMEPIAVEVEIPDNFSYDNVTGEITYDNKKTTVYVPIDGPINSVIDQINAALESSFANLDATAKANIQAAFDNALAGIQDKINGAVEDMLNQVQIKIDETLESVIKDLQGQLNEKVDKFINRLTGSRYYTTFENIVNRLNRVLANPNHYLQSAMLFHVNGKYGLVSNTKAAPTTFVVNGGNAVILVPTTYTAELVSPAYKKFVAVTNVWKTGDQLHSAQSGDATALNLLKQANKQTYVNEIVPGARRTIPFYFAGGQGYTYEIVYQALDYSGITSTQKYYVNVK